jgi:adenosyl cobinamide kinase/adenosyl cobinamide phosphate guanylyltransferase
MIHEKIVFKDKQSVESIESESSNAESNRSMKDNRRASIIFIEIFENKLENAKISYHVRNVDQLKYWLKKDENALIKAWVNIRDENIFVMNEYNKKVMKLDEFTEKYNDWLNELNDAKLMIRELKVKLREKNLENTLLSIIED